MSKASRAAFSVALGSIRSVPVPVMGWQRDLQALTPWVAPIVSLTAPYRTSKHIPVKLPSWYL